MRLRSNKFTVSQIIEHQWFQKGSQVCSTASHLLGRLKQMNHKVQAVLQNEFKTTRAPFGDPL